MKHKVKVVAVNDDLITLRIDGRMCTYLHWRPAPLTATDAQLFRSAIDTRMFQAFAQSVGLRRPLTLGQMVLKLFSNVWSRKDEGPYGLRDLVADYLEKVGTEVILDKDTKALVILQSDIDKVRKGGLT